MTALGLAVVGTAGWGQHVARAFHRARGATLRWVCDLDQAVLNRVSERMSGVGATRSFEQVLGDPEVRAVAIVVDAPNHHRLAKLALERGRHVFVEKPLALSHVDAEELCGLAEQRGLTLMVGHLLLYHPAIVHMRQLLDQGDLGEVQYLHAQRVNLGVVRQTENVWWSLAPHDIAVAIHLFGDAPMSVSATGATYLQRAPDIHDVAFATLRFAGGRLAHLHVSWLDPQKRRSMTLVGTRKMLTFEDTLSEDKLKIHDRAPLWAGPAPSRRSAAFVAAGAGWSPALPTTEPLLAECEHFVACVREGSRPRSDGRQGAAVVQVLEAGERSMRQGGAPVDLPGSHGRTAGDVKGAAIGDAASGSR